MGWKEHFPGLPQGLFSGFRAMTVQGYIESNTKNGTQFEAGLPFTTVASGVYPANASRLIFVTGSKPVIVKDRTIYFNGIHLTSRVYKNTEFTGGTPITVFNRNDIDGQALATTVQVFAGATITNIGTEFGAPNPVLGSEGIGAVQIGSYSSPGLDRVLSPNRVYCLENVNGDADSFEICGVLTWYEGDPDIPLPRELEFP